jgi:hypothetical protein
LHPAFPRLLFGSDRAWLLLLLGGIAQLDSLSNRPENAAVWPVRGVMAENWDTKFGNPIPLPGGRELVTLRDAVEYIRQLCGTSRESETWQVAMQDLSRAIETPAWCVIARRAIMKALSGKPRQQGRSLGLAEVPYERGHPVTMNRNLIVIDGGKLPSTAPADLDQKIVG